MPRFDVQVSLSVTSWLTVECEHESDAIDLAKEKALADVCDFSMGSPLLNRTARAVGPAEKLVGWSEKETA